MSVPALLGLAWGAMCIAGVVAARPEVAVRIFARASVGAPTRSPRPRAPPRASGGVDPGGWAGPAACPPATRADTAKWAQVIRTAKVNIE